MAQREADPAGLGAGHRCQPHVDARAEVLVQALCFRDRRLHLVVAPGQRCQHVEADDARVLEQPVRRPSLRRPKHDLGQHRSRDEPCGRIGRRRHLAHARWRRLREHVEGGRAALRIGEQRHPGDLVAGLPGQHRATEFDAPAHPLDHLVGLAGDVDELVAAPRHHLVASDVCHRHRVLPVSPPRRRPPRASGPRRPRCTLVPHLRDGRQSARPRNLIELGPHGAPRPSDGRDRSQSAARRHSKPSREAP